MTEFYSETRLETRHGIFRVRAYRDPNNREPLAIIAGDVRSKQDVAVRVHSACLTSEILGSLRCDCREQLELALSHIGKNGGVIVYLPQEGRGIGLGNKIRAYGLQEKGFDTLQANQMLGLPDDDRSYESAAQIIGDLGVESIRLITNNPDKVESLGALGIQVNGKIPSIAPSNPFSAFYLQTKQDVLGHSMGSGECSESAPDPQTSRLLPERPFIHLNFAVNGNGNGDGDISCDADWKRVHRLREQYSAIAVGAKTWLKDKPRLTARKQRLGYEPHRQPDRVIFAGGTECPVPSEDRRTFVIGKNSSSCAGVTSIETPGYSVAEPMGKLHREGVESILVEGGPRLLNSFLAQGCIDRITVYVATKRIKDAYRKARQAISPLPADMESYGFAEGTLLSWNAPT